VFSVQEKTDSIGLLSIHPDSGARTVRDPKKENTNWDMLWPNRIIQLLLYFNWTEILQWN